MIRPAACLSQLWWLVHKDLVREYRARAVLPATLMLGWVIVLTVELQMDLPDAQKQRVAGSLLWLAVFLAGTLALDRSFANEREAGCWEAICLYPVSPAVVYLSKLLFNLVVLSCVAGALIPTFVLLSGAPLLIRPGPTLLIAMLANVGFAAVGTLISALTNGLQQRGSLLILLLLPLVLPVVLAASDATRLIIADDLGAGFWRWVQLLAVFAVIFINLGLLLFEFVTEG